MIFFLLTDMPERPRGLGHAVIRRQHAFRRTGEKKLKSKIVTLFPNHALSENIGLFGLQAEDVLNQYDYFQEVANWRAERPCHLQDWCQRQGYRPVAQGHRTRTS